MHQQVWLTKICPELESIGIKQRIIFVDGEPSVEEISVVLKEKLETIEGVMGVSFDLYEGPNQGVVTQ
jgi:hypothetical protein